MDSRIKKKTKLAETQHVHGSKPAQIITERKIVLGRISLSLMLSKQNGAF